MSIRQQFLQSLAPTSFEPVALHIESASGSKLIDAQGKEYIDLIGGISVCNIGHSHPKVIQAIEEQIQKYMHIMVYGELIQTPQIAYAEALLAHLPDSLESVYFTNSGAEAVEGAMKLAKRATGRSKIIACKHSYHGSTQGALSLIGDEYFRNAYRPLLPDIHHIQYNNFDDIEQIDEHTAAIVLEPIQAEAGIIPGTKSWFDAVKKKCDTTGTLLIFDEIQTGMGRSGALFALELLDIVPDILLLGKALGGGLPLGAFIASKEKMNLLAERPILGHLTTFGGHPVSCAAGLAAFDILTKEFNLDSIVEKKQRFFDRLKHPAIKALRGQGLMIAVELENFEAVKSTLQKALKHPNPVFTDWFLFASNCIRIVPPLTISLEEIDQACDTLLDCI